MPARHHGGAKRLMLPILGVFYSFCTLLQYNIMARTLLMLCNGGKVTIAAA